MKSLSSVRIIAGTHACVEALKTNFSSITKIYLQKNKTVDPKLFELISKFKNVDSVPEERLTQITRAHQGVVIMAKAFQRSWDWAEAKKLKSSTILVLDGVEDPHNLGAIVRTSWLLGVDLIVLPERKAVGLAPSVHKVASGGCEHVPVIHVHPLDQFLEEAKENCYWVYALDHRSTTSVFQEKFSDKKVLIFGGEDRGVRKSMLKLSDQSLMIPQNESQASLNVSVSVGIALALAAKK